MDIERLQGTHCAPPFPIHAGLVDRLLAAHRGDVVVTGAGGGERDAVVAHVLGVLSGYSYSDAATVSLMMSRLGLGGSACVRIAQTVDAMLIFSTAFLVQSACGRVVILCYRGTEPTNIGNWLADADVGPEAIRFGGDTLSVHAGFYRNLRATRWPVLEALELARSGRSLADPETPVEHPLEAFYVTGHSLGGAMAILFGLSLSGHPLAELLRAVYTFGQPLVIGEGSSAVTARLADRLFRHVLPRDLVPGLPAERWGRLAHFGHEYRWSEGDWRRAQAPTPQFKGLGVIPRSLLAFFGGAKRRRKSRYSLTEHGPHQYLARLRPAGKITEFGDSAHSSHSA
jgi:hypothetical protein